MAVFDVGDLVRISASFFNSSNALTDPTTVMCKYKNPAGTSTCLLYATDAALGKTTTGIYYTDVNVTQSGTWHFRFWSGSTGSGQTAGESLFQVRKQNVP